MIINNLPLRFHKSMFHANLKRIHQDSCEAKCCHVENDAKNVNSVFLSPVSMGLVLVFMQSF